MAMHLKMVKSGTPLIHQVVNRHKKKCSVSLVIKETQIYTIVNYCHTPVSVIRINKTDATYVVKGGLGTHTL